MNVINQTQNTTLAENIIVPKTLIDQSLGLLKYKTPTAMILKSRFGIHTFGMSYPIDVLIVNKQNQVVTMNEHMKPNRIFLWNPTYETILELPAETIKKTRTKIGDALQFLKKDI
ncbi:MAG TPA: DUF192 domain-containing protein [Candidatus Saccharimonadales bacterium]|nr:DUF192 domain-containing protein [Candidatus Saccharimonadales bacterium]